MSPVQDGSGLLDFFQALGVGEDHSAKTCCPEVAQGNAVRSPFAKFHNQRPTINGPFGPMPPRTAALRKRCTKVKKDELCLGVAFDGGLASLIGVGASVH